jgi:two-component system LytT family response regulator
MTGISVLVVDDEAPARTRLLDLLEKRRDVGVAGEVANGEDAARAIRETNPDLVFLDIQMPGLDGLDVVRAVGPDEMPVTVFVTAYDEYAVRAFEAHALDYLMKPFSDERFDAALERARRQIDLRQAGNLRSRLRGLLAADYEITPLDGGFLDYLVVRRSGHVYPVPVADIDYIEGAGVYVRLHTAERSHLYRTSLSALEEALDPAVFQRIHRSTIVNISRIRELVPEAHGDCAVFLQDGTELRLSRTYRTKLRDRFGQNI